MAEKPMTDDRLQAGREYLEALRGLGFRPETMLWVIHVQSHERQLAIVSSLVDRVGSLDIYKALFDAYDRAATPKSIDPFTVSLYSPKSIFALELKREMKAFQIHGNAIGHVLGGGTVDLGEPWRKAADYIWRESWVYVSLHRRPEVERQLRQWQEFKHNVENLAA